ncbi:hypothetical protein RFI_35344, partial [Reticulomyxa filosa]
IEKFIEAVKKWSWHAILQEPELELFPKKFKKVDHDGQHTLFNEKRHKKSYGSDSKSQLILYCVWPSLRQQGCVIQDVPIEVVVRDNLQGQPGATPNPSKTFMCCFSNIYIFKYRIESNVFQYAIQQQHDKKKDNNTVKTKQNKTTLQNNTHFVLCFALIVNSLLYQKGCANTN